MRNAFGRQVDSFETDLRVDGLVGAPVRAVFIPRPGSRRSARRAGARDRAPPHGGGSETGAAAGRAVAVRQGRVLATAFHPELTGDLRIHALFCDW